MGMRTLVVIPVRNEARALPHLFDMLACQGVEEVLVVDDGSEDASAALARKAGATVISHPHPRGYGAALRTGFQYALDRKVDVVITLDGDLQHPPSFIPRFLRALEGCRGIASGTRYHPASPRRSDPPPQRRRLNRWMTWWIRRSLGLPITDAFCGYKAYHRGALRQLEIQEDGYGMPLEVWVQVACKEIPVVEVPVPLYYPDPGRRFPSEIQAFWDRWTYYRAVIERSVRRMQQGQAQKMLIAEETG